MLWHHLFCKTMQHKFHSLGDTQKAYWIILKLILTQHISWATWLNIVLACWYTCFWLCQVSCFQMWLIVSCKLQKPINVEYCVGSCRLSTICELEMKVKTCRSARLECTLDTSLKTENFMLRFPEPLSVELSWTAVYRSAKIDCLCHDEKIPPWWLIIHEYHSIPLCTNYKSVYPAISVLCATS